jgi:hypothetical protein
MMIKLPTPGREEGYDWIVWSLEEVSEESIRKTYKYIGFVQNDDDSNIKEENTTSSGSKSETEMEEEGFFEDNEGLQNEVGTDEDYQEAIGQLDLLTMVDED